MAEPFLRIYGSSDWCPTPGNDGSCYLLDDRILIDTGWRGVTHLIDDEIDPLQAPTMLFTHLHPDHRLALPQLIMYWRIKKYTLAGLTRRADPDAVRSRLRLRVSRCGRLAHRGGRAGPRAAAGARRRL